MNISHPLELYNYTLFSGHVTNVIHENFSGSRSNPNDVIDTQDGSDTMWRHMLQKIQQFYIPSLTNLKYSFRCYLVCRSVAAPSKIVAFRCIFVCRVIDDVIFHFLGECRDVIHANHTRAFHCDAYDVIAVWRNQPWHVICDVRGDLELVNRAKSSKTRQTCLFFVHGCRKYDELFKYGTYTALMT